MGVCILIDTAIGCRKVTELIEPFQPLALKESLVAKLAVMLCPVDKTHLLGMMLRRTALVLLQEAHVIPPLRKP